MKRFYRLAALLALGIWTATAHGDGGAMLLHQDAGPFTVTLFANPQPLEAGAADFSVMVEDRKSGEVLLDPVIDLGLAQQADVAADMAADAAPQPTVRLARSVAGNRLVEAANVNFPRAGQWRLTLTVARAGSVARLSTECTVVPASSRATLVWFYVLLPVGIVLLFILHQTLKLR